MIRCGSDQTHVKKGGRNVTNGISGVMISILASSVVSVV
jgi:hypothetical protein